MTDFQPRQRHFVAIATAEYTAPFRNLPGVKEEVDEIQSWLTGKGLCGRRFKHQRRKLAESPSRKAIEAAFRNLDTRVDWCGNDAAVVYVTGHGETHLGRHFIVLKETVKAELDATGFVTTELFHWLGALKVKHLLVIVDACFAGEVTEQIEALASEKRHWLILPSATSGQKAQLSALTNAISQLVAEGRKYNTEDPYFRVGMFVRSLNEILAPDGQKVGKIYKGDDHDEHVCLPNPSYQPGIRVETAAVRRALALPKDALELHNRVGGRPVAAGDPAGWLFTGREELMHDLIHAARTPGVTMVTGSAGCGKSTALSRLVTLSDPVFRERYARELPNIPPHMLPPLVAVHLAVSAREKSNEDLLAQICLLLRIPVQARKSENPVVAYRDALSEYLGNHPTPVTIVIDALDEAKEGPSLVRSVLARLRQERSKWLCLLIGVRSPGGDGVIGDVTGDKEPLADLVEAELGARRIAADKAPWWNPDDVDIFVSNILTNTSGSPYRNEADTVAGVSKAISKVAGNSYLMAKVAAESLAGRSDIIAPNDPAWLNALNEGLLGVLRDDLKVSIPSPAERRQGVALLRAVAFGRGAGLPWQSVWPRVATAVDAGDSAGRIYGDGEVEWLLGSRLNAYLATDRQDDLTVYRLLHDQLQKTLQHHWRELLEETPTQAWEESARPPLAEDETEAVEERIVWELIGLVSRRPSIAVDQAPPIYVRRHLAEHALAAGVLGQLPISFLPYLDLARLRAAIGVSTARRHLEEDVPWLAVIRQVTHLWDWDRPANNAAAIEMWAALTGTRLPGQVGGSWRVRWAVGPPDNGSLLGRHDREVSATATADLSGTPIVVTGGQDGMLWIWDLSRGMRYREPIQTGGGAVWSVATARLPDGRTVAVTGCADGVVRIWELRSGRAVGGPLGGGSGAAVAVTAAALPDGRVVVAAADESGTIRTWDLTTRDPVGAPLETAPGLALGLATAEVDQQVLGLATGLDGGLQIWDLASGAPLAERLTGHEHARRSSTGTMLGGRAIAAAVRANREIAITGYGDGMLFWDLRDRAATGQPLAGNDGTVRSLAVVQRKDRIVAVTGGNKAARAWDLTACEPAGELLTGHDGSVDAVAVIESPDGTLVVSGSRDKTVRVWEIAGDRLSGAQPSAEQLRTVNAVTTARLHGHPVAITCSSTVVQVRDLERGTLVAPPLTGHASTVVSVAAAELPDGGVLVVASGWNGSILAWSAADGTRVGHTAHLHGQGIASVAMATLADRRIVAVTGGWDRKVRVWDPYASAEACEPLPDHADAVRAVVTATADGRSLLISGSTDGHVRIRDLDAHVNPDLAASWPPVDVDTGDEVASLAVAEFPDERLGVVVGTEGGTVRLLDLRDGTVIGQPWRACPGAVAAVAASRPKDGRITVFTGSTESLVQAWDISTGRALAAALPTPGPVRAMTYHHEPPSLLIGGAGAAVVHLRYNTDGKDSYA